MKKIPKKNYYTFAVSDFDGTLFSSTKGVADSALSAIKNFKKAGGTFCICTGRMTSSIAKFYEEYDFGDYVISFNGAEVHNVKTGENIFESHVDNDTCVKLLRYAEKNNRRIQVYPNGVLTVHELNDDYREYAKRCHVTICDVPGKVSDLFIEKGYTSGKVLFYTDDEKRGQMLKEIKAITGDNYEVICSNKEHIDVMAKGVSKGNALLILCNYLGVDIEKTICFGDEKNDLSMLKFAGLGAATANGNPDVLKEADVIVPACDDGGVGAGLELYCIKP